MLCTFFSTVFEQFSTGFFPLLKTFLYIEFYLKSFLQMSSKR